MHLQWLFTVIRRWLRRERALAPCALKAQKRIGYLLLLVTFAFAFAQSSFGSVLLRGDVTPADNPFTTGINEGLPSNGNSINQFAVDASGNPLPNVQPNWEGITLNGTSNQNIDEIVVGKTAFGSMVISGESVLNDQTLTIGGQRPKKRHWHPARRLGPSANYWRRGPYLTVTPSIIPTGTHGCWIDASDN